MFDDAYDTLVAKLGTIVNLRVVTDPGSLVPPCVLVEAPSFLMQSGEVAEMDFNVVLIGMGVGGTRTLEGLLGQAALIQQAKIGLTDGRPTTVNYAGTEYPAYQLTIKTRASA